jgi:Rieske Fe-S protein
MADDAHDGELQPAPSRRSFVDWFLGTCVGALLVAILYPIARYLVPPEVVESTAGTVTLPERPADVKPNTGLIFRFGSQPGILIRTPAGELRAFSAVCTHLGCTVQYRPDLIQIWCACHDGHYDLNGQNVSGPPPRPLPRYVVNVRGDQIIVSKTA